MRALLTVAVLLAAAPAFAGDGLDLFKKKCAGCHGEDGAGKTKMADKIRAGGGDFPDFTDAKFHEHMDAKAIKDVITNGVKDTKMAAFKEKLTPEEIDSLVKVVQAFKK
jgi:mono/diheme cytochrome c family protein